MWRIKRHGHYGILAWKKNQNHNNYKHGAVSPEVSLMRQTDIHIVQNVKLYQSVLMFKYITTRINTSPHG